MCVCVRGLQFTFKSLCIHRIIVFTLMYQQEHFSNNHTTVYLRAFLTLGREMERSSQTWTVFGGPCSFAASACGGVSVHEHRRRPQLSDDAGDTWLRFWLHILILNYSNPKLIQPTPCSTYLCQHTTPRPSARTRAHCSGLSMQDLLQALTAWFLYS